jgi:hypothetical protein
MWWEIVISFIIFTTTDVDGIMDIMSICVGVVIDAYMNVWDTILTSRWMTFHMSMGIYINNMYKSYCKIHICCHKNVFIYFHNMLQLESCSPT